ncbi:MULTISPECIES: hypothetical protein [Bradyrhizobium]|uniref:hypothetical protein n=1 Tax=Bradyrhizobium TaxID=374 RepID=UPI00040C48C8|nr:MULTISPECIES: hypothetical protein [Bradyrhizobium]UFW51257.1 hypothetical protein BaraCB756_09680 [Bradyrhizobium arachidis]
MKANFLVAMTGFEEVCTCHAYTAEKILCQPWERSVSFLAARAVRAVSGLGSEDGPQSATTAAVLL